MAWQKGTLLDQLQDSGEAWQRKIAEGLPVPASDGNGTTVVSFPLGTEETETGALSFVFSVGVLSDARRVLEQISRACQAIWRTWHIHAVYVRDILRIADLEAELADSKIADRAQALLEMGELHRSPVDTISRSVATILGPYQLGNVLKKLVGDLERDAAEYALVRQAGITSGRSGEKPSICGHRPVSDREVTSQSVGVHRGFAIVKRVKVRPHHHGMVVGCVSSVD
jgi:hypothetical protein